MPATATPSIYDPKILARDNDVNNSDVTEYTAPVGEAGVKVTSIQVVNKTASSITLRLWRRIGGTNYYIAYDAAIPGNGLPLFLVTPDSAIYLEPGEEIHAQAGSATGLDLTIDGIEMKD
jgi:hypothetical protein